jgi:hypothetical protein
MKTFKQISIVSIVLILILSCSKQEETKIAIIKKEDYIPTKFPVDTTKLWISNGLIDKDTVLIVGEGGPKNNLDFESNGRVYWEYLPNYKNYNIVVIHQSSSYNKLIFGATNFNLENAYKEVDNSSEILYRAIKYYKDRNKYVVVFGHSYSAFIIPNYLSTRPNLANKYIITSGRIDADSLQTELQLKGINTGFEEDGKTLIIPEENEKSQKYRMNRYFIIRKNKELLKYAIGKPRYSIELANKDLSNLVFYYGKKDQNVGALTDAEVKFLISKKAKVFGVNTNHYIVWQKVIDAIHDGSLKL